MISDQIIRENEGEKSTRGKMLAIRNTTLFRLLLQVVQLPTFIECFTNTLPLLLTQTTILSEFLQLSPLTFVHTYAQIDCQIVSEGRNATW